MKKTTKKSSQTDNLKGKNSKIIPLGDRILIKPFTDEEINKKETYGIIIPDTVSKEKSEQGKVIAVGEGRIQDGKRIPISVNVGDTVIFSKYGYDEVNIDDEELYLLKEDNILAILK